MLCKTLREVLPHKTESQGWIDIYNHVVSSGESIRFERELLEQARVLELHAYRLDVRHRRVGVVFADVTARTKAEQERIDAESRLRELNANLEREVIERSAVGGRFWQTCPRLAGRAQGGWLFRESSEGNRLVRRHFSIIVTLINL